MIKVFICFLIEVLRLCSRIVLKLKIIIFEPEFLS